MRGGTRRKKHRSLLVKSGNWFPGNEGGLFGEVSFSSSRIQAVSKGWGGLREKGLG